MHVWVRVYMCICVCVYVCVCVCVCMYTPANDDETRLSMFSIRISSVGVCCPTWKGTIASATVTSPRRNYTSR